MARTLHSTNGRNALLRMAEPSSFIRPFFIHISSCSSRFWGALTAAQSAFKILSHRENKAHVCSRIPTFRSPVTRLHRKPYASFRDVDSLCGSGPITHTTRSIYHGDLHHQLRYSRLIADTDGCVSHARTGWEFHDADDATRLTLA